MAVTEQHFRGFEPWSPLPLTPGCPLDDTPWFAVWFEAWYFMGSTHRTVTFTGIAYEYSYAVFNKLGEFIQKGPVKLGPNTCGAWRLDEYRRFSEPRSNDWLLDWARGACKIERFPRPGTSFLLWGALSEIGSRVFPVTYNFT